MNKQRGMALLMVLLMMSVMAIIAVNINGYWQRAMTRAQSQQDQLRAKWLLLGGEIYAKRWLQRSLDKQPSVNLGQAWAREDIAMRTEQGEVSVRIINADACFNLNALAAAPPAEDRGDAAAKIAPEKRIFMLLLSNLAVTEPQAEAIAEAIITKITGRRGVAETAYLFADVSELREMNFMSRELYARLAPLVCARPDNQLQINLNTVTAQQLPLIRAMLQNALSAEQVLALIGGRPREGWRSLDFFTADNYPELGKLQDDRLADRLAISGSRFTAELRVTLADGRYRLTSAWRRGDSGVRVIRRQFGWGEG
ncbi:Type II secretory pathway, component PulK [Serratia entomophila]|uniref:type II secretion system minor pseudopilin GspK n=1 Tax=Serratia entomophila TaxID=42906 RepID=UPI002178B9FB|nr:type II secretion system minor pseudopilin GspK [Serratia entomophila]CAI0905747.1 Type II secretory pathway, component PulK [Serratia entomophila]CAI0950106.1 Type II secretory pathway, component PulK [Serratia entomophila]CAI2103559.1 Type II secretory pathway, component PulK [Serratia entomophila]